MIRRDALAHIFDRLTTTFRERRVAYFAWAAWIGFAVVIAGLVESGSKRSVTKAYRDASFSSLAIGVHRK
jgi:hypothetical protein